MGDGRVLISVSSLMENAVMNGHSAPFRQEQEERCVNRSSVERMWRIRFNSSVVASLQCSVSKLCPRKLSATVSHLNGLVGEFRIL